VRYAEVITEHGEDGERPDSVETWQVGRPGIDRTRHPAASSE
jgi:hypothetical protein